MALTIEDKIVERVIVMMRKEDIILNRSTHDPTHIISKHTVHGLVGDLPRVLRDVGHRSIHSDFTFRLPHCADYGGQQTALEG